MLTAYASGGPAMLKAAADASANAGAKRPKILAVTVLTSLDTAILPLSDREAGRRTGPAACPTGEGSGIDGIVAHRRKCRFCAVKSAKIALVVRCAA